MNPARFQTIEEIFRAALDQEPEQVGAFLEAPAKATRYCAARLKRFWIHVSEQTASLKLQLGLATRIIENGQADSLVGQTIGHYKISKWIGTGGMGEVYLATDITAGRRPRSNFCRCALPVTLSA